MADRFNDAYFASMYRSYPNLVSIQQVSTETLSHPLSCVERLAEFLGTSPGELKTFFSYVRLNNMYSVFYINKDTGKIVPSCMVGNLRKIEAPKGDLKYWQSALVDLFKLCPTHACNYAYINGKNTVDAANAISTGDTLIHVDLKDFFTNHSHIYVLHKLQELYPNADPFCIELVTRIVCKSNHLPQGSPCSPILSVVLNYGLDCRVHDIASKYGLVYTRYADDLCFSGNVTNDQAWEFLEELASNVHPFTINRKKVGIMRDRAYPVLTGVKIVATKLGLCATHINSIKRDIQAVFPEFEIKSMVSNYRYIQVNLNSVQSNSACRAQIDQLATILQTKYPKHNISVKPTYFYIKSVKHTLGLNIDDTGVHYPRKKYNELRKIAMLVGMQDAFREYWKTGDNSGIIVNAKDIVALVANARPVKAMGNPHWRKLLESPISIKSFVGSVNYVAMVSPQKAQRLEDIRRNAKRKWLTRLQERHARFYK